MPAELLEKPVEVEEDPRMFTEAAAIGQPSAKTIEREAVAAKSLWQKVFEGHEELLGCTPD